VGDAFKNCLYLIWVGIHKTTKNFLIGIKLSAGLFVVKVPEARFIS
jgi:hypothetical protein